MRPRSGFTLIELMIALGMSLVVVYGAFAALRVATQTLTACNRLSLENSLLRTGFIAALEDLDHWTSYDNPAVPAEQPLRAAGLPFARLTYDPDFRPHRPETWWRNFGYASNSKRWGSYELFARLEHDEAKRAWLSTQMRDINAGLGHYAMVDYLPGNTVFSYYQPDGTVPDEFVRIDDPRDATNPLKDARAYTVHRPTGTAVDTPRDIWKLTHHTTYCVTTSAFYRGKGYNRFRFHQTAAKPWRFSDMQKDCRELRWLVPANGRPQSWPTLSTDVRRYVVWSHNMDVCTVEISSPITGQSTRFSFWGIGTTLRGARQQRGLDTWRPSTLTEATR